MAPVRSDLRPPRERPRVQLVTPDVAFVLEDSRISAQPGKLSRVEVAARTKRLPRGHVPRT